MFFFFFFNIGATNFNAFHPKSLKLQGSAKALNESVKDEPVVICEGFVTRKIIFDLWSRS